MAGKKRILFVDDELRILQGLRRMLRGLRHEWDMLFAESGEEALNILKQQPVDIIVCDMRMPGMNGAELLKRVMESYPQVIRIVLSGHSDRELIMKTVRVAHQYLSKPCDAEKLKTIIVRACNLRNFVTADKMKEIAAKMETLPSLPALYTEIMDELQNPGSSLMKIGVIIEKDMGMSAKLLQLVNSAFFGLPQHIAAPSQAVSLLGLDIVKALVLSVQVFSQFEPFSIKNISLDSLWLHSNRVGSFAKKIYESESSDKNNIGYALIGGMLHDLGKLIFMQNFPDKYDSTLSLVVKEKSSLIEAERKMFGVGHAELGAYLLGLWGLPDLVVEAVAYHHSPKNVPVNDFSPLCAVYIANAFEHELFPETAADPGSRIDKNFIIESGYTDRLPVWKKICQKIIETGDK